MSKNRTIASLISNASSKIKSVYTDSDAIVTSATLGVTAAAGTAIYSSSDTLPVSANNGDQALVTSTNRLYIFTNGGWYNIALVNTSPYFTTSPNASYELSNTGAQTNIEILAVDSEGLNITYSTVADSDFSTFATITKDSDNGRRFTITVDSDQSVGATGTVTFRASDGVNIVSKNVTFNYTAGFPTGFIEYETFESSPSNLVGYDNGSGYSFAVVGVGGSGVTFTTSSGSGLITKNGAYDAGFVKQYSFTSGNTYYFYADGLSLDMVLNNRVILFIGTTSGGSQKANLGEWTSNGNQSKSWTANETGTFYVTLRSVTTNTAGSFSLDRWRIREA